MNINDIDARAEIAKLKNENCICETVSATAKEYGVAGNCVDGANIAGFKRVADTMMAETV